MRPSRSIMIFTCMSSVLAGCAAPRGDAPVRATPIPYTLDTQGVQLSDRAQRIDFGRTEHSAISAMTKLVGSGPTAERLCGQAREVRWADGTALVFVGGDLRGWVTQKGRAGQTCAT